MRVTIYDPVKGRIELDLPEPGTIIYGTLYVSTLPNHAPALPKESAPGQPDSAIVQHKESGVSTISREALGNFLGALLYALFSQLYLSAKLNVIWSGAVAALRRWALEALRWWSG